MRSSRSQIHTTGSRTSARKSRPFSTFGRSHDGQYEYTIAPGGPAMRQTRKAPTCSPAGSSCADSSATYAASSYRNHAGIELLDDCEVVES